MRLGSTLAKWAHGLEVAGDVNGNVASLMAFQVVEFDGAKLLDDDCIGAGRSGFEVEAIAVQGFRDLLRLSVIGEKADGPVAIGKKIDCVADPHGVVVVGVVAGNFNDGGIFEIGDPDGGRLSTVIALPVFLP